ncbi:MULTISPECIES: pilus assembly protein [unclassified Leucobacter]|uniref:pilus assembly protein n=1 Tax=unclassified Leucobacter TaxID=2621730 RepID=UPI00165E0046|nr:MULTISPECIES: pilus assembly protein [unclassified Leucobacter]MBC9937493.1 pilus assembly protein [Leucobacter sp. cx-87]
MHWARLGDRGAVTAEFAIVLPTALLVLGFVLGGVLLGAHRVALTSAAADVARLEARGDAALAAERLGQLPGGTRVSRSEQGGLTCVTLRASPVNGPLRALTVSATACAARS